MPRVKIPWPPQIPARLKNTLTPFTAYAGGWCRWHINRMVHVCGKGTPLDEIEELWTEKKREMIQTTIEEAPTPDGDTVRQCAAKFYLWLDRRVEKGRPEPLALETAEDYKREINGFGKAVGADRAIATIDASDFTAYAQRFDDHSPYTLARVVAYISAFFRWCKDEGYLNAVPNFGRSFVKPSLQAQRDKRLGEVKSYSADQLWQLWAAADTEIWAWMSLALCGAFDNADIANLTFDVLDRSSGTIDYRRRKKGRKQRMIAVPAWTWRALDAYLRHRPDPADPAHAQLVFLTPTGLPLRRRKPSPTHPGRTNPLDYLAMRWSRLMIAAGLRPPLPKRDRNRDPNQPEPARRHKARGAAAGQGFRSLRTTWGNLVPPGYGDEREIVMGHAKGTFCESYLERLGSARLAELVGHIWSAAFPVKDVDTKGA